MCTISPQTYLDYASESGEMIEKPVPFVSGNYTGHSPATGSPRPFASEAFSEKTPQAHVLPDKRGSRLSRYLTLSFFSVYRQLFAFVATVNIAGFVALLSLHGSGSSATTLSKVTDATAANLMVAILMRHEHIINLLFILVCYVANFTPLFVRKSIAKIYHLGGIHSGCGVASFFWYMVFTVMATIQLANGDPQLTEEPAVVAIAYLLVTLLFGIILFALPRFRQAAHNHFEAVHRFAGWTALALFWAQTLVVSETFRKAQQGVSLGRFLSRSPAFWFLVATTSSIIYPWLRLRKVRIRPEYLSRHAVRLHFEYNRPGLCVTIRVTDNPLKEWHAFATIPGPQSKGFSMLVSAAGDWTNRLIEQPPAKLWVRGAPTTGVLRCAVMFSRIVLVATGSGIGPILSLLVEKPDKHCRVLWSTRSPEATYGNEIVRAVHQADQDALIIDTTASGARPDMVTLTYRLYMEYGAEAVFVISNPKLTRKVVYGMESRGIPAFGPIWDS